MHNCLKFHVNIHGQYSFSIFELWFFENSNAWVVLLESLHTFMVVQDVWFLKFHMYGHIEEVHLNMKIVFFNFVSQRKYSLLANIVV